MTQWQTLIVKVREIIIVLLELPYNQFSQLQICTIMLMNVRLFTAQWKSQLSAKNWYLNFGGLFSISKIQLAVYH